MDKVNVYPTICEQTEDMKNYKEVSREAYLKLTEKQAHSIVFEATSMLETFMMNYDTLNIDAYALGGILDRFEQANEIVQALKTLNTYKKKDLR